MQEDLIEFQEEDFEFAAPPMSKDFLIRVFEKYDLKFIAYFGGDMFYAEMTDKEPFVPFYGNTYYVDEVEFIMDFMTKERLSLIMYENGSMMKKTAPALSDDGGS